jgi:hypothetical protein
MMRTGNQFVLKYFTSKIADRLEILAKKDASKDLNYRGENCLKDYLKKPDPEYSKKFLGLLLECWRHWFEDFGGGTDKNAAIIKRRYNAIKNKLKKSTDWPDGDTFYGFCEYGAKKSEPSSRRDLNRENLQVNTENSHGATNNDSSFISKKSNEGSASGRRDSGRPPRAPASNEKSREPNAKLAMQIQSEIKGTVDLIIEMLDSADSDGENPFAGGVAEDFLHAVSESLKKYPEFSTAKSLEEVEILFGKQVTKSLNEFITKPQTFPIGQMKFYLKGKRDIREKDLREFSRKSTKSSSNPATRKSSGSQEKPKENLITQSSKPAQVKNAHFRAKNPPISERDSENENSDDNSEEDDENSGDEEDDNSEEDEENSEDEEPVIDPKLNFGVLPMKMPKGGLFAEFGKVANKPVVDVQKKQSAGSRGT